MLGLPTRVSTSKFISKIASVDIELLKPYSLKILNAFQSSLVDSSSSVRKAYCYSCASVARLCDPKK
jgi:hypothetical protein